MAGNLQNFRTWERSGIITCARAVRPTRRVFEAQGVEYIVSPVIHIVYESGFRLQLVKFQRTRLVEFQDCIFVAMEKSAPVMSEKNYLSELNCQSLSR